MLVRMQELEEDNGTLISRNRNLETENEAMKAKIAELERIKLLE